MTIYKTCVVDDRVLDITFLECHRSFNSTAILENNEVFFKNKRMSNAHILVIAFKDTLHVKHTLQVHSLTILPSTANSLSLKNAHVF